MTSDRDDKALKRAQAEAEKSFGPPPHDQPTDDPIERLGRRIGRVLSFLLALALLAYLWHTYLSR
jgi:hypothetical protein